MSSSSNLPAQNFLGGKIEAYQRMRTVGLRAIPNEFYYIIVSELVKKHNAENPKNQITLLPYNLPPVNVVLSPVPMSFSSSALAESSTPANIDDARTRVQSIVTETISYIKLMVRLLPGSTLDADTKTQFKNAMLGNPAVPQAIQTLFTQLDSITTPQTFSDSMSFSFSFEMGFIPADSTISVIIEH